jgi:hypothetical protein
MYDGATVKLYCQGKTEGLREKPTAVNELGNFMVKSL